MPAIPIGGFLVFVRDCTEIEEEAQRKLLTALKSAGEVRQRGVGASGLPKVHVIRHGSRKSAKEAARQAGQGEPLHDIPADPNELPHYHPTDRNGKKIENGVHYAYPKSQI